MNAGKYPLIQKLAAGGMAEVFLTRTEGPLGFEKLLVLKRILPHLAEDPAFVEMFRAEAKLAAQLNHPYLGQIFDFGEADGAHFLVMEYIDGPNLRVLIKRAREQGLALPPALCARIIAHACEGMAFAHDYKSPATGEPLGLIHRDISPDNILLSRQGAVKVVDFGVAKSAEQSHKTLSGVLKGKLAYMAPEQIRCMPLDRRVDVYALGVVLYQLLTGHKPFSAVTDASIMRAVLFEPVVPAVEYRPDLPEALQRILARALAKDRELRYPDCHAFQEDLERFILSTGRAVSAYHVARLIEWVMTGAQACAAPPLPSQSAHPTVSQAPETMPLLPSPVEPEPPTPLLETSPAGEQGPARARSWSMRLMVAASVSLLLSAGVYAIAHARQTVRPPRLEAASAGLSLAEAPPPLPSTPAPPPAEPPAVLSPSGPAPLPTLPVAERPEVLPPAQGAPKPAAPSQPVKAPSSSPPQRVATGKATLEVRVRPYAIVYIDGRLLGQTPLGQISLSPGRHTVTLSHPALRKPEIHQIEVKAGEHLALGSNLAKKLQAAPLPRGSVGPVTDRP